MMTTLILVLALQQTAAAPPPVAPQEYLVGPQDKLDINVIPEVFSDKRVTVDVDGSIQYKDIGRVKAQDMTLRQIQAEIRKLLIDKNLHRDPTVTVEVVEYRSKMIYINGDGVRSPSSFRIQGSDTLMSVIYQAGGFTSKAGPVLTIRRRVAPGTQPVEIQIPRTDVEQGTGQAATLQLQDGDLITAPEMGRCFVRGEVNTPGAYDITQTARTVFDMINAAGGFTRVAAKGNISLTRLVGGKPQQVKIAKDLTTEVLPNDVIEVKRRRW